MAKPTNAGVIVALIPEEKYTRTRPTVADHHLTVAYLGRYDDDAITDSAVQNAWKIITESVPRRMDAEITGQSVWHTPDGWAHVDLIDCPELPAFRCLVEEALDITDLPLNRIHGLLPHITRRYIQSPDPITLVHTKDRMKFRFSHVAIWMADDRYVKELG